MIKVVLDSVHVFSDGLVYGRYRARHSDRGSIPSNSNTIDEGGEVFTWGLACVRAKAKMTHQSLIIQRQTAADLGCLVSNTAWTAKVKERKKSSS